MILASDRTRARWTLILPLKGGPAAKSRLGAGPELASAIALDCVEAVLSCPLVTRVIVVTDDPDLTQQTLTLGAETVTETRPGSGLVAAITDALVVAGGRTGPVAVLLADLPALRPADLADGLEAVQQQLRAQPGVPMAVIPDAEGTGTVLLGGRDAGDLDPAFGPDSLAEHHRRGAVIVGIDLPRLRRDVDTPADLSAAIALGLGPRSTACTASLRFAS